MSDKTILGRTITGDIEKRYYKPVEQWDAESFIRDLDAVFDADPTVAAINWTQYTPYFNDGDPCEFGAHLNDEGFIAFEKVPTEWRYDEAFDEEGDPVRTSGGYGPNSVGLRAWSSEARNYVDKENPTPLDHAADNLSSNWAHYEDVLREHFGEHSRVIATREGFNVEFYEHD